MKLSNVLENHTPSSKAVYTIMGHRSDGDIMRGKGPKPKTETDKKIHLGHIVDSGQYNLRHVFDHSDELAFDYKRLTKDKPKDAQALKKQTIRIAGRNFKKMGLKLSEVIK